MTDTKLQNGSHIIVHYGYSIFSLYFWDQQIGWKDIFLLGKCERDTSGRYETLHWNFSILPSNDLWIDFELILCDEHRTPKRKSCLLIQYRIYTLYIPVLYTDGLKTYSKRNWKSVPILGSFLAIFLPMIWSSFTKLRFRRSFWDA